MKLSISNIAWDKKYDDEMYQYLADIGFEGIEIAPTRFIPEKPYDNIEKSVEIVKMINEKYHLSISSMQSIWYGRWESIFGTKEEKDELIEYTEKAVRYAESISCKNLVFGNPKNRNMENKSMYGIAVDFFRQIGKYAENHDVVIALEPNPVIYNTNFINNTEQAISFVKEVNSKGLLVNMDLGTVIWNNENLDKIFKDINLIHHIHISEPYLARIENRELHKKLKILLLEKEFDGYVSIEMKNFEDINIVKHAVEYINEVMR